ncbi:carboxypeptidase regulatory-like domain-containing protein [Archangium violaceum]|uniref:carboxypeptidase-like regulatory domain-containing protein n=1 Tax=Archangium violaceum TaxID=83451 RepID=UPI00194EC4FF|nr:carboxypeptidase-like regulatory domain-containing protein [Archangium violaceum]QRN96731.1 carboxypeptidase regulatory-like domain-containing protein [Archangium violaceum]
MMRPSHFLCCALLGLAPVACGPGTSADQDPAVDRSDSKTVDLDHLTITVAGRAEVFPEAARLLEARGQPVPTLDGVALTIEEPLRIGVNDADSVFGRGSVGTEGGFAVPDVPVRDINLSLATSLEPEGFVRSSTVVFDTVFTRTRPRTDIIGARAWALPNTFHDTLTQAVGESWIRAHTEDRARALREAGFILGRVVDASGAPVAGARVVLDRGELANRVYYPAPDFQSATQDATSATGLFLYVHSGAAAESFTLSIQGARDYLPRHAGAAPGRALVLTLYPGNTTP